MIDAKETLNGSVNASQSLNENTNINTSQSLNGSVNVGFYGYELPIASESVLGGIKVGDNLTIDEDGTLNAKAGDVTKEYVDDLIGDINSVLATLTEVS